MNFRVLRGPLFVTAVLVVGMGCQAQEVSRTPWRSARRATHSDIAARRQRAPQPRLLSPRVPVVQLNRQMLYVVVAAIARRTHRRTLALRAQGSRLAQDGDE